jgi:hypothetical protein
MAKQSSSPTTSGLPEAKVAEIKADTLVASGKFGPAEPLGFLDPFSGSVIRTASNQADVSPLKKIMDMVQYVVEGGPMPNLAHVIEVQITGSYTSDDEAIALTAQMQKLQLVGERCSSIARDALRARGK